MSMTMCCGLPFSAKICGSPFPIGSVRLKVNEWTRGVITFYHEARRRREQDPGLVRLHRRRVYKGPEQLAVTSMCLEVSTELPAAFDFSCQNLTLKAAAEFEHFAPDETCDETCRRLRFLSDFPSN
ncbi:hypothetical protein ACLMJV_28295 [Sinorhizobium meliloti]|uniref:hypothetical protein n=1 Tax=Rhizobium meliloti TaxID=382 RepID=UPI00398CE406